MSRWSKKFGGTEIWAIISDACGECTACHRRSCVSQLQRMGCDIGRTTYAKYEAGELNIRASVLIALKQIYDCTYDDFFLGLDVVQEKTAL